jgi:mannonate dehydratase
LKITGGKVIVCSPGRNFVTLKLETEDGVYGLGDATLNGRELAVASYLRDHVLPLLEGRDAGRIEDVWQFLYKGAYWRRGPVTMAAIAAVDTALWDIKGKALNTPVYQLLGGASRDEVLVYGHANGETIDEAWKQRPGFRQRGYKAVRAQCGVPGMQKVYGVASGTAYEPAQRGRYSRTVWSSERYLSCVAPLFEQSAQRTRASTCTCCTTCTTGCGRSRPRALARISSRIACSGSRIRRPPTIPRASA